MPARMALAILTMLMASLAVSACGGSGGSSGGRGVLIFTRPDGIMEYDLRSAAITPLITTSAANTFVLDAAVSADGTRLAYINQPPPKIEGTRYDAGSDLWIANRDGSDARLLFEHVVANQLVRYPKWGVDGSLYAIVQEIETASGITSVVYTLQRFDADTGERTTVLRDVLAYALSPDGARIAYARFARETGEAFESIALAGGPVETLVAASEKLAPFASPQYAPDGKTIAFASADQTRAPVIQRSGRRSFGATGGWGADGLPQDIWTIPAEGGRPTLVSDLKEDLPAVTWNGDGTKLYVLGVAGLYEVDLENGATTRIGEGAFHGQILWVRE